MGHIFRSINIFCYRKDNIIANMLHKLEGGGVMQIVPSLELCQHLNEKGYPQGDCTFYWYRNIIDGKFSLLHKDAFPYNTYYEAEYFIKYSSDVVIAAPTVEEMVEWLRGKVWVKIYADLLTQTITVENPNYKYSPSNNIRNMLFNADTLSDTVAQACIWVLEQRAE
jgi:hypothetical protein